MLRSRPLLASGLLLAGLAATGCGGSSQAAAAAAGVFTLTSDIGAEGGTIPIDYTIDGSGASPALSWTHPPAGTQGYALLLTTLPGDGTTLYNWVLYDLPASATGLAKNTTGLGKCGMASPPHAVTAYAPPQSTGPGSKTYTFTLHALSGAPSLPSDPASVTGEVLASAIAPLTLGSAALNLVYARSAPAAGFTYATQGLAVAFKSSAASGLSASSWAWDFGDGTTSTAQDPGHTYAASGNYTVSLVVGNAFGTRAAAPQTVTASAFTLTSGAGADGGTLPAEFTCDGAGESPALAWTDAPQGTQAFALLMTTPTGPGDVGTTKWNWVLYNLPATTTSLARNATGIGTPGAGSEGGTLAYEPPCSQGPDAKYYTFTIYALSQAPVLPVAADQVTGAVLTQAISTITLGSASITFSYTRP